MTTLKLFFHDACFDGAASAALFAAFYRTRRPDATIVPVGLHHKLGDAFADAAIDGDDNACVDFRYCPHPAMRWWFDHHATAFHPAELAGGAFGTMRFTDSGRLALPKPTDTAW